LNIYTLNEPELPQWGDYGHILISGMTSYPRKDGLFQLERSGPFVPPISFPVGAIIVTNEFKEGLCKSGLTGLSFKSIIKSRIVHLEWQKWDRNAEDPKEYPSTGEPEDYILERPHSPDIADKIGKLWELCLEEHAEVLRVSRNASEWGMINWSPIDYKNNIIVLLNSWDGIDLFKARGAADYCYVSEKAKSWLEQTIPEWISFNTALTK
jgi:hypothetical protein